MTPLGRLLLFYEGLGASELIWPILEHCGDHGIVLLTPEVALVARPARRDWPEDRWADLTYSELPENADAWHIFYAAGNMKRMEKAAPYRLPWVAFHRRGGSIRIYSLDRLTNGLEAKRTRRPAAEDDRLGNQ